MFPYFFQRTRIFEPGASADAFESELLLPLFAVQGPGNFAGSLAVFGAQPVVQNQGAADAWNGLIAGQFVSQPLTDSSGQPQ